MTLRSILCVFLLSPCHLVTLSPCQARADGGTVRLSEQQGKYRITVFTAPTVLRAGPVDISVLVQDADTGEPASGVQVTIRAEWRGSPDVTLRHRATTEAATNKLYYAATFDLPEPGWYSVEVSIDGPLGGAEVHFEMEAAEPPPPWLAMLPWVGWPALAILLFSIHQRLVRWRSRRAANEYLCQLRGQAARSSAEPPSAAVGLMIPPPPQSEGRL
jgi:hypothetical protein